MGPALQAAYLMMEALGGKLLLFQTSLPNVGVGKITQRDNPTLYNTDSEHRLRVPEDIFFKKFAAEASKAQISIDAFSFRYGFRLGLGLSWLTSDFGLEHCSLYVLDVFQRRERTLYALASE